MATNSTGYSEIESSVGKRAQHGTHRLALWRPATTPRDHQPAEVLADMAVLLEEYAPVWYVEDLRHRVLTAMRLPTDVLVEVCAVLEDHAPSWYTDQQRGRALATLQALGLLEPETL